MDRRKFLTWTAGALTLATASCNGAGGKAKFTPESPPPSAGPATRVILTGVTPKAGEQAVKQAVRAAAEGATDFAWLSRGDAVFIKPALNVPFQAYRAPTVFFRRGEKFFAPSHDRSTRSSNPLLFNHPNGLAGDLQAHIGLDDQNGQIIICPYICREAFRLNVRSEKVERDGYPVRAKNFSPLRIRRHPVSSPQYLIKPAPF